MSIQNNANNNEQLLLPDRLGDPQRVFDNFCNSTRNMIEFD